MTFPCPTRRWTLVCKALPIRLPWRPAGQRGNREASTSSPGSAGRSCPTPIGCHQLGSCQKHRRVAPVHQSKPGLARRGFDQRAVAILRWPIRSAPVEASQQSQRSSRPAHACTPRRDLETNSRPGRLSPASLTEAAEPANWMEEILSGAKTVAECKQTPGPISRLTKRLERHRLIQQRWSRLDSGRLLLGSSARRHRRPT